MENLTDKYEQIVLERKKIIEQMKALKEDEQVKKYLELRDKNLELDDEQTELYKQLKVKEYSSCNHIWIHILDYKRWRWNHVDCGCVKCGLDRSFFQHYDLDLLTFDQKVMYDVMKDKNHFKKGIDTYLVCNFDLGKAIYSKIKEAHPNIDDETAIKYLKAALYKIRDIKVSDERKISRAKRLSLSPKFNQCAEWTVSKL